MPALEAELEFDGDTNLFVHALTTLPGELRLVHFSSDEDVDDPPRILDDRAAFDTFVDRSRSGFFLKGPVITCSLRIAEDRPLICNAFIAGEPMLASRFLMHMARVQPRFGFACDPKEREHKNRVTTSQGSNTIESWVGRDTDKYLPGFYWLTLLSQSLADRHGIALEAVRAVAIEQIELGHGQHLFRFHDRPQDWPEASTAMRLCASLPGVFDIGKVRAQLAAAKNFLELAALLKRWK